MTVSRGRGAQHLVVDGTTTIALAITSANSFRSIFTVHTLRRSLQFGPFIPEPIDNRHVMRFALFHLPFRLDAISSNGIVWVPTLEITSTFRR